MASVKVLLKKEKINKNGEAPIYLRLIKDRKPKYISVGVKVKPKDWNEIQGKVRKSHKNSQRINNFIAHKIADAEAIALEMVTKSRYVSPKKIKENILGLSTTSFIDYFQQYVSSLKKEKKISTYDKAKTVFSKLTTYLEGKDLTFDEVDIHFLKKYEKYLAIDLNNSVNTIHSNLKIFRKLFNDAIREDIFPVEKNPFLKFRLKTEKTTKEFLTEDELFRMENLDLSKNPTLDKHRDLYVFACYAGGLRISDILQLKWRQYDGLRLLLKTQKTKKDISIKLPSKAKEIIEKYNIEDTKENSYIFPFLPNGIEKDKEKLFKAISSKTAHVNKNLKKIAELSEINKNIHFHTSRHTFATRALRKGMRIEYVSSLLTHSSIKTTQIYAKIVNQDLDDAMDKYFN